jgi:hypothetical protein
LGNGHGDSLTYFAQSNLCFFFCQSSYFQSFRFHSQTSSDREAGVQSRHFRSSRLKNSQNGKRGQAQMNWKRLILGTVTALAMMAATYMLPRGGALRDASLVQFPMTVGVWAIFVLLFVKLK